MAARQEKGERFLLGEGLTDADIRLYPTIARFDVAYHTLFMCNLRMIRWEYPAIQKVRWGRGTFCLIVDLQAASEAEVLCRKRLLTFVFLVV